MDREEWAGYKTATYLTNSDEELVGFSLHFLFKCTEKGDNFCIFQLKSLKKKGKTDQITVRTGAVMFDMSPVVKYRIKGPDAEKFLNILTTRQVHCHFDRDFERTHHFVVVCFFQSSSASLSLSLSLSLSPDDSLIG